MSLANTKVGRIVADDFRAARVMSAHGIDFCCRGGITLKEACAAHQVDEQVVLLELGKLVNEPEPKDFTQLTATQLVQYIIENHHTYVEKAIPFLKAYLNKLCTVHGERHPELFTVRDEFEAASGELTKHMKKEELILFPYIKAMDSALSDGFSLSSPHFGHIDNPISMMQHEHDVEGERFRRIATTTDNYTPPKDGCQTYKVAFAMLQEFQDDLHTHIHLENNILFPQAQMLFGKLEEINKQ